MQGALSGRFFVARRAPARPHLPTKTHRREELITIFIITIDTTCPHHYGCWQVVGTPPSGGFEPSSRRAKTILVCVRRSSRSTLPSSPNPPFGQRPLLPSPPPHRNSFYPSTNTRRPPIGGLFSFSSGFALRVGLDPSPKLVVEFTQSGEELRERGRRAEALGVSDAVALERLERLLISVFERRAHDIRD